MHKLGAAAAAVLIIVVIYLLLVRWWNSVQLLPKINADPANLGGSRPLANPTVLVCPSNTDSNAGLCYPKCKAGYKGVGPVCWSTCPTGYRDDGAYCAKPTTQHGRGVGMITRGLCEKKYGKGKCEKQSGLWYQKCRSGFKGVGPMCWPTCPPNSAHDIGVSCAKGTYGRGVGKPVSACPNGKIKVGALCYDPCPNGYYRDLLLCKKTLP